MLIRQNSVVFLSASIDACALWRHFFPHYNLPGSSFFCFAGKPDWNVISAMDVAVVQRCCTQPQFDFLKTARQLGMKIIYDLDDNVWELPEYNPAHQMFMAYRQGFAACISGVDLVTVSTHHLRKEVKKHVRNPVNIYTKKEIPIVVCENKIDSRFFSEPSYNERITVGWQGSSSHVGDLLIMEDAIRKLSAQHPDVDFEFRGCDPSPSLRMQKNVTHKMWMPVAEYAARMPKFGWHIATAPLTDHAFNESKSAIKMIEAGYCKIPCLASWLKPYAEFCDKDPELGWLLCAGPSSWYPKLKELINDKARREFLGKRMYDVVTKHYSFATAPHEGWRTAVELVREI